MQKATSSIEKKGTNGVFAAAAKKTGMSTLTYARKILAAKKGVYSTLLRKRASLAKTFITSK